MYTIRRVVKTAEAAPSIKKCGLAICKCMIFVSCSLARQLPHYRSGVENVMRDPHTITKKIDPDISLFLEQCLCVCVAFVRS